MHETERRSISSVVELRSDTNGGLGTLFGYGAKFGVLSQNLGGFVERIDPAAFDKSIADGNRVLCRAQHMDNALLGTTESGTLTITVDDVGLLYDVPLPDTTAGRDCSVLAKRGDLRYSSFAFDCIDEEWGFTDQGFPMRTLLQVQLKDVAPVNSPAYLDATVALRSFAESGLMTVPKPAPPKHKPEPRADESTPETPEQPVVIIVDAPAPVAAEVATPPETSPDEQRATHSPVNVRLLQLELDALR